MQKPDTEHRVQVRRVQDARAVLDVKGALKRLGGRKPLYLKVLQKFASEYADAPETIQRCIANSDKETANRIAHSIKGASAGIGAMALSEAAANIEKVPTGMGGEMAPLLMLLDKEMACALDAIRGYLKHELDPKKAPPAVARVKRTTDQSIDPMLHQLVDFLATGDMRSVTTWEQLKDYFQGIGADPMVAQVDQKMDRLDFDGASHSLNLLVAHVDKGRDRNERK
jgi:two-component system sensor histidine kinase/response regulator